VSNPLCSLASLPCYYRIRQSSQGLPSEHDNNPTSSPNVVSSRVFNNNSRDRQHNIQPYTQSSTKPTTYACIQSHVYYYCTITICKLYYKNYGQSYHMPTTKSTPFMVSENEWDTKRGPGKGTSRDKVTSNSQVHGLSCYRVTLL